MTAPATTSPPRAGDEQIRAAIVINSNLITTINIIISIQIIRATIGPTALMIPSFIWMFIFAQIMLLYFLMKNNFID